MNSYQSRSKDNTCSTDEVLFCFGRYYTAVLSWIHLSRQHRQARCRPSTLHLVRSNHRHEKTRTRGNVTRKQKTKWILLVWIWHAWRCFILAVLGSRALPLTFRQQCLYKWILLVWIHTKKIHLYKHCLQVECQQSVAIWATAEEPVI